MDYTEQIISWLLILAVVLTLLLIGKKIGQALGRRDIARRQREAEAYRALPEDRP